MASILQVGGKWRAQVRRAGQKPIAKSVGARKEAEQWARQLEVELDHQRVTVSATMNLGAMIKRYRRIREELGSTRAGRRLLRALGSCGRSAP
jgi:hypothetical protein